MIKRRRSQRTFVRHLLRLLPKLLDRFDLLVFKGLLGVVANWRNRASVCGFRFALAPFADSSHQASIHLSRRSIRYSVEFLYVG